MLAQHFVKWCETANTLERCSGVAMLAEAITERKFLAAEIRQAEAALLFALDDPSPRVRRTIADATAGSDRVSRQLVRGLASDIDDVAVVVAERSPILLADDLVDLVRAGSSAVRSAIARRSGLGPKVASALAMSGDAEACLELVRNDDAELGDPVLRELTDRFADDGRIGHALLQRRDLRADMRRELLVSLGNRLCGSAFVSGVLGAGRANQLQQEVDEQATAALIDLLTPADLSPFVEHLRVSGQLNAAILIRAVCSGRVDLFASSLARLSGVPEKRVRAIIVDAREPSFMALVSAAGLPRAVVPLLLSAIRVWKDVSLSDDLDPIDIASTVMERVVTSFRRRGDGEGFDELCSLLHRLSAETQRFTARRRAERYLAA